MTRGAPLQVLVVEDNAETRDLVARALAHDGHTVLGARDAAEALGAVAAAVPQVIVLDLGLPDMAGVDLCRALRRRGCVAPLLVLTAHGAVDCRVECLDAGADDFLAKPFAIAELRARVRALGRRRALPGTMFHRVGEVELDLTGRRATRCGVALPLTAREWAVVELLAARAGQLVPRAEILEAVWGEESEAASASLDVIVARIRRKLGDGVLRTARGEGYALEGA
ncbi:MAG: response regulator transcription factor [Deltaproteobacteria bacterium]|nr:response regulator transcription factor [Deltaproteobacteria bacterium]